MRETTKARIAIAVLGSLVAGTLGAQETVAIVGATVIDGNGGPPLPEAVIVVDGDRIAAIGPASSVQVPRGARIIDAAGKFATPGFIDTNVHLSLYGGHTPERYETLVRYHDRQEEVVLENAQLHLKYGVTT
ncbi:MAG TPA: hydrolase, partial [Vicinamibacteria bacterium]|nr:hydrolase [Vicinamibacteria bacterium]